MYLGVDVCVFDQGGKAEHTLMASSLFMQAGGRVASTHSSLCQCVCVPHVCDYSISEY